MAVEAAAAEMGMDLPRVTDGATAHATDVVLAIGYPDDTPWLAEKTAGTRVSWLGEPLPPPGAGRPAGWRRQLPMGRMLDGAIVGATFGGRRPVPEGLVDLRERAAYEHDQRINLEAHLRAARVRDPSCRDLG